MCIRDRFKTHSSRSLYCLFLFSPVQCSQRQTSAQAICDERKNKMKKIGILGGISAASTVQYYNKILDLYYEIKKDYYYPEICIESLNFQYFTDFENRNDMDGYKEYIMKGIRNLESAGSDIIIMSANSPHSVFHAIEKEASVPMLSLIHI